MSSTTRTSRRQRCAAVALSLPLALSLTGTAFAAGVDARPMAASEQAAGQLVLQGEAKPEKSTGAAAAKPEPQAEKAAEPAAKAEAKQVPAPAKPAKPVEAAPKAAAPVRTATSSNSSSIDKHGTATSGPLSGPQPLSKADKNGTGANPGETCTSAYCSTRDGSASQNGKGDGGANGKPCAGCVGKADNKNPQGQAPNGTDHNAGYECDRNQGIGKGNPAHTGCTAADTSPTKTPTVKPTKPATPTKAPTPKPTRSPSSVSENAKDKVTICHATGSATNPYVVISPSKQGVLNGHVGHQDGRDIIPSFSYVENGVTKHFPGQNWNATTQELFGRGCTAGTTPPGNQVSPTVLTCPNGATMPGNDPANCPTAPPVCPTVPVMGPVQAGCSTPISGQPAAQPVKLPQPVDQPGNAPVVLPVSGGGPIAGQPAAQPASNPVPLGPPTGVPAQVVAQGTVTPLAGTAAAPARARVAPSTLPFTGTDAMLLVELGALLLLVGGGVLVAVRRERTARAAA